MKISDTIVIRNLLKEHRPIAQEGVGLLTENPTGRRTLPLICECGEGTQDFWNDSFGYLNWLDHFQVALLDSKEI